MLTTTAATELQRYRYKTNNKRGNWLINYIQSDKASETWRNKKKKPITDWKSKTEKKCS